MQHFARAASYIDVSGEPNSVIKGVYALPSTMTIDPALAEYAIKYQATLPQLSSKPSGSIDSVTGQTLHADVTRGRLRYWIPTIEY